MLLTPVPGTSREGLLGQLSEVQNELINVRGRGHTPSALLAAYLGWANNAVRHLRHSLRAPDVERLILTRRYWTLQGLSADPTDLLRDLVEMEIEDRTTAFADALGATQQTFTRWDNVGRIVVADTSFFHHYPAKLDEVDLSQVLGSREAPIGLVIPMVVIDELERQKGSKDKHLRWRSSATLAVIERVARYGGTGRLREANFTPLGNGGIPSGEHRLDVLFDPDGHTRLPIADDEIVDRARFVQLFSGKPVSFLTYDTNQVLRARHAEIADVKKLEQEGQTGED